MITRQKLSRLAVTLASAAALAACGSTPPPPELVDARAAYQKAQASAASTMAPAQLHEAKVALDQAEGAFGEAPESPKARDLSYYAQRKSQWAEAQGNTLQANKDRDKAQAEANRLTSQGLAAARGELSQTKQALATEKKAREAAEKRARDALDKLVVAGSMAVREEPRGTVIVLPGSVLFPSAKWDLLPTAQEKLSAVAEALKNSQDESKITVEGHTDSQGSESSNLELGQRRAASVRDFLVSRGIKSDHISAVGIGQSRPIADNKSAEGRANNRRVEIIITPIERR